MLLITWGAAVEGSQRGEPLIQDGSIDDYHE